MNLQRNLSILLIPLLILTLVWVGSNIYHSYVDSTVEIPLANSIKPIKGSFDMDTLAQIKSRTRVDPLNDIIPVLSDDNLSATPSSDLDLDLDLEGDESTSTESAEVDQDDI